MTGAAYATVLVFVFLLPWERNVTLPLVATLATPAGALAIALTILATARNSGLRLRRPPLLLAVMLLLTLWSFMTYFWSVYPSGTLVRSMTYAQLTLMVWMLWQIGRERGRRLGIFQAYVLGGHAANVMVLVSFVRGVSDRVSLNGTRYSIGSGDPNYLASAIALGIPLAWYLFTHGRGRWMRWINLLYIPSSLTVIGLAASRGGMLTALTALLVIPAMLFELRVWQRIGIVLALAALLPLAVSYVPQQNVERLLGTTTSVAQGDISGRYKIWSAGLEYLDGNLHTLVIGVGTLGFRYAVAPILGEVVAPHNSFLSVLVDNGLVGFGLFMTALLVAMLPYLRAPPGERNFGLVLWGALMVALLPLNWEQQKTLWFVLALLTLGRAVVLTESAPDPLPGPEADATADREAPATGPGGPAARPG